MTGSRGSIHPWMLTFCALLLAVTALPGEAAARSRIAFSSEGDIFTMRSDGSGERRLRSGDSWDASPVWSPDGRYLLFARGIGTYQARLFIMRRDGAGVRAVDGVPPGVSGYSWSPNGRRIVFSRAASADKPQDIYVVRRDGSRLTRLTRTRADERLPKWSPSGRWIAFIRAGREGEDLWLMDPSGERRRRLTDDVTGCRHACDDYYGSLAGLNWGPGGRRIVFGAVRRESGPYINILRLKGGMRRLAAGAAPTWSPSGRYIAFTAGGSSIDDMSDIFRVRVRGGDRRRLSERNGDEESSPNWGIWTSRRVSTATTR